MRMSELGAQEQIAADQFRAFYAILLGVRDAIVATTRPMLAAPAAPLPGAVPPVAVAVVPMPGAPPAAVAGPVLVPVRPPPQPIDAVRTRIARAIADLGYRHDELIGEAAIDAGYVLAALADDVILERCEAWDDYQAWAGRPLEAVLYGTRMAGGRVFDEAEELIARRRADPRLATTILLALLTGFRGRYLGSDDPEDARELAEIQAELYDLVCHRAYRRDDPLPYAMPDLVATTLEGHSVRRLPPLWPWLAALALLVLAYFPVSHLIWKHQVGAIDELADTIVNNQAAAAPTTR